MITTKKTIEKSSKELLKDIKKIKNSNMNENKLPWYKKVISYVKNNALQVIIIVMCTVLVEILLGFIFGS